MGSEVKRCGTRPMDRIDGPNGSSSVCRSDVYRAFNLLTTAELAIALADDPDWELPRGCDREVRARLEALKQSRRRVVRERAA
jgi:hypothetical protein